MKVRVTGLLVGIFGVGVCAELGNAAAPARGALWIDPARLAALPTSGAEWENVWHAAQEPTGAPNLSDPEDPTNVRVLAKALVHARTGEERYRAEVVKACLAAIGTERGSDVPRKVGLGDDLRAHRVVDVVV